MNTKTTLYLAVLLAGVGALYFFVQSRSPGLPDEVEASLTGAAAPTAARDVLDPKLGDIEKVVCRRHDGPEWVFEKREPKSGGAREWRMTAPLDVKCLSWELDRIGRQLNNLQYEVSYQPGQKGAITARQAGLDPPKAVVTLTDVDGASATVEVGGPAPQRATYVRVAGTEGIRVGKADLSSLIKDKALAYRDRTLWTIDRTHVTRVEIDDRSAGKTPVHYAFVRDGARWMIESPITARATAKVDDMLGAMSRLSAMEWLDDDPAKLPIYGLDPATWIVRATVTEEVEVPVDNDEETGESDSDSDSEEHDEPKTRTETRITQYVLHLSNLSPIGEDTKSYLRIGDESAVATVLKSTADKFKPVLGEWRDLRVTPVSVRAATRIELSTGEASAVLVKTEGTWAFESDGGPAEQTVVDGLLAALANLSAVVFVDAEPVVPADYGLDAPQAVVRLTIPGVEGSERIAIGGYTDAQARRLVYVRRNDLSSVAKVRAADVAKIVAEPVTYRDRTIVEVLPSRFERITLATTSDVAKEPDQVTLEKQGGTWVMTSPVAAALQTSRVDRLVEAVGGLRAENVVDESGALSAYGLHAPMATLSVTYKPPVEYRVEETKTPDGEEGDTAPAASPVEVQPPSRTIQLIVTRHEGKVYATRSDRPAIYQLPSDFLATLQAELRSDRVVDFEADQVQSFSIRDTAMTHTFERQDDKWVYGPEPDTPLDSKKIENLLLQIRDLRTVRYVRHQSGDLATYGLTAPAREVTVILTDGDSRRLLISDRTGGSGTDQGFFATVEGSPGVFLLTPDTARRLAVSLDNLE